MAEQPLSLTVTLETVTPLFLDGAADGEIGPSDDDLLGSMT